MPDSCANGNGMIDAALNAVCEATGVGAKLKEFNVSAVTGGIDALGDVVIQAEYNDIRVSGRGVSTDVVEASARAFLNAVNRIVRIEARNEKRDIETGP